MAGEDPEGGFGWFERESGSEGSGMLWRVSWLTPPCTRPLNDALPPDDDEDRSRQKTAATGRCGLTC